MNEPTNTTDIDALLRYLLTSGHTQHWNDDSTRWRAALTALIAERNSLRDEIAAAYRDRASARSVFDRVKAERDALQRRIAELEAQQPASDLRERLDSIVPWMDQVTAMLCHSMTHSHDAKQELVTRCDNAIAAMRKGDA